MRTFQRGFTLIELMVALAITSMVLAAGAPGISELLRTNELYSTADQLAGNLRLARQLAVSEGVSRIVSWDSSANTYRIIRDDNENGQVDAGEPNDGDYELPSGVAWSSPMTGGFSGNQLSFGRNGSASQTGTVLLHDSKGRMVSLTLLGPTGQVKLNPLSV